MRKRKLLNYLYATLLIFAIAFLVSLGSRGADLFSSFERFAKTVSYGVFFGTAFWIVNASIGEFIRRKQLWHKNPRRGTTISLLLYLFSGIIISLGIPYIYAKYVFHVEGRSFVFHVFFYGFLAFTIDLILVIIFFSKYLVKFWIGSIQNAERFKQEKLIAQFETLKNQVNPHFLFNSLNTLTGIVEQTPEKAVLFIKKLSDIYRYVLEQKDKELVAFAEELKFVNDYVYLQKIRHGSGLDLRIEQEATRCCVTPLALQMLVENAIKHNVVSDDKPLKIEILFESEYLTVKNNLQMKKVISEKEAVGLDNLIKRYQYLTDKKVLVEDDDKYFIVKLPLLTKLAE